MFRQLFFVLLLLVVDSSVAQKVPNDHPKGGKGKPTPKPPEALPVLNKKFLTLNGGPPEVVARGGYSGIVPESSDYGYNLAMESSLPGSIMYCNLQLTKDNLGICASQILIDNATTAARAFPKGAKTYNVNGRDLHGWFALDYSLDDLKDSVHYVQGVLTRTNLFDDIFLVLSPDYIGESTENMWINVEYDMFYNQHNLSVAKYILESSTFWVPSHISSPEIGFLKYMSGKVDKTRTKLILKILGKDEVEPTTMQKYGSILDNLAAIKPFASAILVPKTYIIPVKDRITEPPTTLVVDAHKIGLQVYASDFANDDFVYNYSFNPVNEYLQFIDNNHFSVDGVLTDFPSTASSSIACFAQSQNITTRYLTGLLIITSNGASGDYPGCTDLAYQKAIDDGADIIDCTVQMSKDGVAFCMGDADLSALTTALTTFMDRSVIIPEIRPQSGVFSFDLTWTEILSLKPTIETPLKDFKIYRSPGHKNMGKFMTLADFLELAKTKKAGGVLINIQNAAYLASQKGFSLVDVVTTALANGSFDKQSTQRVMIQSDDSSVLSEFKKVPTYERVLFVRFAISDAPKEVVAEVKKYADAVVLEKSSIIQQNSAYFTTNTTRVVDELHAANISVYAYPIRNEFTFLSLDCFADPYLELTTLSVLNIDGFVTEYPATASSFLRNPCFNFNVSQVYTISAIVAGSMLSQIDPAVMPPPLPPAKPLSIAEIVDPPLPPVSKLATDNNGSSNASSPAAADEARPSSSDDKMKSSAIKNVGDSGITSILVTLFFCLFSFF